MLSKCAQVFMYGPRQILTKFGFIRHIFLKTLKYPIIQYIRPVGAELLYAEGRTDWQIDRHDEANSRFSRFANAPKSDTQSIDVW